VKLGQYRFSRPDDLELVGNPKLSVAVVIACRDGQEKLNLTLASLALQTYSKRLTKVYVIDDGSSPALVLPKIRPVNTKLIKYKNQGTKWGKTAATNDVVAKLREDVLWFVDADMVFEPDHLAHHMKWHHDSDDYAVLGWKRFVKEWDYTPASLTALLKADGFDDLHAEHWGKKRWEDRLDRTKDLVEPGIEGFRNFVGATFSLKRALWESVGGYNETLKTGEDTELGWRLFLQGVRMVPERQAHSWHLGFTAVESNKAATAKHNDPAIGQFVPGFAEIRKRGIQTWAVPTFETLIDCRGATLEQIRAITKNFQKLDENQGFYRLLGPWMKLEKRYSISEDPYANLREIHSWLLGDPQYSFEDVDENAHLTIEEILENLEVESSSYFFFVEGDAAPNFQCLSLYLTLMDTGNGLIGFANQQDRRAFAVFAPALARAQKMDGGLYRNIADTWGIRWFTSDEIIRIYEEKVKPSKRAKRFIKSEVRKIKGPMTFLAFFARVTSRVLAKVASRLSRKG
jgi:GT2 family glycosyltransferase